MRLSAILIASILVVGPACNSSSPQSSTPGGSTDLTIPTGCAENAPVAEAGLDVTQTTVQHLGTVKVGTTVPFTVPLNTVGLTIVEQVVSAPQIVTSHRNGSTSIDPNTAVPLTITDANGKVVFDDRPATSGPGLNPGTETDDLYLLPSFFGGQDMPATGTVTIPNTTTALATVPLAPGAWTVQVSDFANECANGVFLIDGQTKCDESTTASTYDVTVITRQASGGVLGTTGGTIDVTFYFATATAGGSALRAASAKAGTDPDVTRLVQTLRSIYQDPAGPGLAIGNVDFVDVDPAVQAALAAGVTVDQRGACAQLSQLLARSHAGNTANVFIVSRLTSASTNGNATVVGVDGTVPGPAGFGGTVASGAAVSGEDLRLGSGTAACPSAAPSFSTCGADETAYIIAHEMGHFLGLFHPTEAEGTDFDTLLDTPTCKCSVCKSPAATDRCADASPPPAANTSHQMSSIECTSSAQCGGGDHLMFWLFGSKAAGLMSDQERQVIRTSPLVRSP